MKCDEGVDVRYLPSLSNATSARITISLLIGIPNGRMVQTVKAVLKRIAEEEKELFAQRVARAKREKREEAAASARCWRSLISNRPGA